MADSWIRPVWERKGLIGRLAWLLLLPGSWLYRAAVQARNLLYSNHWLRIDALERPVISIGNLTVGGTGKTPSVLWLARELGGRGLRVGILSRGYKRDSAEPVVLLPEAGEIAPSAAEKGVAAAGDEPFMMAGLYGQLVAVGNRRYEAGKEMLRVQDVDVFVLDDGFQHRSLKRDVDVLVLGNESGGCLLPCGPFREPRKEVRRADYFLVTGAGDDWQPLLQTVGNGKAFSAALQASALIGIESNRWKEHPLTLLYRSKILAVSGVANPAGLYRIIHDWEGEIIETAEFPDHHRYSPRDWQQINRLARNVDLIVTTEKDLVKLARFPFAKDRLVAVRVAMVVENGAALVQALGERIGKLHS
jgi:tetraacyldisaccharide 4'-kinase